MNVNLKTIGLLVKLRRKEEKISQTTLASQLGVDQATISRIEKGNKNITLDVYKKVLHYFHLTIDENNNSLHSLFNDFYEAYDQNNLINLEISYKKALEIRPIYYKEYPTLKLMIGFYYYILYQRGSLEKALVTLEPYQPLLEGVFLTRYFQLNGLYLMLNNRYDESYKSLQQPYDLLQEQKIEDGLLLFSYGWISFFMGHYTTSVLIMNRAYKIFKRKNNEYRMFGVLNLYGLLNMGDGNYKEAIELFKTCSNSESFMSGHESNYYNVNRNLGLAHFYNKEYEQALHYFDLLYENTLTRSSTVMFFMFLTLKISNHPKLKDYLKHEITGSNIKVKKQVQQIFSDGAISNLFENASVKELETIIGKYNLYGFTYFVFENFSDSIFHSRQYSTYKNIFDLFAELRMLK